MCLRKMLLVCLTSAYLLSHPVASAAQTVPIFDDKGNGKTTRETTPKNLNIFFLIDVSESMRPFADYLNSFNRSVSAMKDKEIGLRINRVYAYWDSTASSRDMTGEPNFMRVNGLESLKYVPKSGDRNYAEPLMRAFKKVLNEIESLQNKSLIPPEHEKLLFIITEAGPNDLTDGAFNEIVARTQLLNLRVYFVYPSRHGVRKPGLRMDDHPDDAYNQLQEMIVRFEKSNLPGQAASFRRFQVETTDLPSQTRRFLEAIKAPMDPAESQGQRVATGLLPMIDVGFIAAEKSAAAEDLQAAVMSPPQGLAPDRNLAAEPATVPAPVELSRLSHAVVPGVEITRALIRFDEKKYTEALNQFATVYGSQIDSLQKQDQRRTLSLLSLPPKCRAEVIFLVEFERIRKKSNNDRDRIKIGLEDLLQDIENRQGPWVVIPEIRRERIKKHITEFQ